MDGYVTIGTELDTKSFDAQIDYVKSQLLEIEDLLERADAGEEIGKDTMKLEAQYETLLEKLRKLVAKKQELDSSGTINLQDSLTSIGNTTSKIVKNITKWGLALFGIRTAYSFIRNAVSQVAQEDENMKQQIQYINYAVGTALKPVLEFVLNIIYKIIGGIGAVIKLITGVNIFAKATASNFAKANSSAGDLRKTLAGFDEMNIIGGAGGTGLLGDIGSDFGKLRDLSTEVETISKKIKEWFTKSLPTREELESNANMYKTAWQKVGEFLGLGAFLKDFKDRLNELKEELRPLWQPILDSFNAVIGQIKSYFKPFTDYINEHFINPIKTAFTNWKDEFLSKYAKFINKLIYYANLFLQYFGIQLDYIDEESATTGKDIQENIGGAMQKIKKDSDETTGSLGGLWQKLKDLTNRQWDVITNFVISGKDKLNQQLEPLRQTLASIGIKLPYLAKGGIINMPGRGVPVGGAIGGERGTEGVIPLTDSQQMALLGEAIGKYVTINATIPVYAYNRQVDRQIKRIQAEDNFAGNR